MPQPPLKDTARVFAQPDDSLWLAHNCLAFGRAGMGIAMFERALEALALAGHSIESPEEIRAAFDVIGVTDLRAEYRRAMLKSLNMFLTKSEPSISEADKEKYRLEMVGDMIHVGFHPDFADIFTRTLQDAPRPLRNFDIRWARNLALGALAAQLQRKIGPDFKLNMPYDDMPLPPDEIERLKRTAALVKNMFPKGPIFVMDERHNIEFAPAV